MSGAAPTEADEASSRAEPASSMLRVVDSNATPEEIAALVAVLASLGDGAPPPTPPRPQWQAHHRKVRLTLPHGSGGWRSSALPR